MTTHNKDKIIAAAKEASFCEELWDVGGAIVWSAEIEHLLRFYAIAFEAGRQADKRDAERYRWLRDIAKSVDWSYWIVDGMYSTACRIDNKQMDEAIDRARSTK